MRLLSIDPGSKSTGVALFQDGELLETRKLVVISESPLHRRVQMARLLDLLIHEKKPDIVVSEEPQIQGVNGNYMHRLLGMIEFLSYPELAMIHPMTVKKAIFGSGKAEKIEVALAAGELLASDREQELLATLIAKEDFDETDAIAVGLAWFKKNTRSEHDS